jgi:hypothetical protein
MGQRKGPEHSFVLHAVQCQRGQRDGGVAKENTVCVQLTSGVEVLEGRESVRHSEGDLGKEGGYGVERRVVDRGGCGQLKGTASSELSSWWLW